MGFGPRDGCKRRGKDGGMPGGMGGMGRHGHLMHARLTRPTRAPGRMAATRWGNVAFRPAFLDLHETGSAAQLRGAVRGQRTAAAASKGKNSRIFRGCALCNKTLTTADEWNTHVDSKKHARKIARKQPQKP